MGFWQLFLLTILNILFYVGIYKKYTKNVQGILVVFTLSSLLLIASAGYKVFMYVTDYGLSYEKFFAFYTVIFCVMVFAWFISLFVRRGKERVNIICSLAFMALWMYAFATIIPLEKFIFNTNLKLTQQENSRVDINELKMLGFDALSVVEENFDVLIKEAREDYAENRSLKIIERNNIEDNSVEVVDERWVDWINENRKNGDAFRGEYTKNCNEDKLKNIEFDSCECNKNKKEYESCYTFVHKKWYEKTFGELLYRSKWDIDKLKKTNDKVGMKTFKNSVHGFAVNYDSKLEIDYDDASVANYLLENDYEVVFEDGDDEIYINFYNINDPDPSKKGNSLEGIVKHMDWEESVNVDLVNVSGFAMGQGGCNSNASHCYFKLVFKTSKGIVEIKSNKNSGKSYEKLNQVSNLTTDEYLNLMTSSKELQDVIKSFRLIETTK